MTMTKTEAIEWIEWLKKDIKLHEVFNETKRQSKAIEALNMAIKALEKQFLCEMCEYEEGDFVEACLFG